MKNITIVFPTNRKNCKFDWFIQSLHRELGGNYEGIRIVVVDYWAQLSRDGSWNQNDVDLRIDSFKIQLPNPSVDFVHVPPKPTPWQGLHRRTSKDYFAAANARNTGICYALDGWVVFADDQAVLMPGWFDAVQKAIANDYIVFGAYKKVKEMYVDVGRLVSYKPYAKGVDSRWNLADHHNPVGANPSLLYGCSFAAPVEALLKVNGLDENCDSTGGEDYILGIRLANAGYKHFRYDRTMLTLESEDLAGIEKPFARLDKGVTPNDRSHALLKMAQNTAMAPNFFGPEGIAGLRQHILAGGSFPTTALPEHDFFDSIPLATM